MKSFKLTALAAAMLASTGAFAAGETITDDTAVQTGCLDDGSFFCGVVPAEAIAGNDDVITHTGFSFNIDPTVTGMGDVDRLLVTVIGAQFTLDADTQFGDETAGNLDEDGVDTATAFTPSLISLTELALTADTTGFDLDDDSAVEFHDIRLDLGGATSGDTVSVRVEAQRSLGQTFTTIASATGQVAQVLPQLGLSLETFGRWFAGRSSEVVNATNRLSFTTNSPTNDTSFTVGVTDREVAYNAVSTAADAELTATVDADWAFLDLDGDGTIDSGVEVTASAGDAVAFDEDFTTLTLTGELGAAIDGDGTGDSFSVDFEFDGSRELPIQSANADVTYNYAAGARAQTFEASSNILSWTLEGTTDTITYMPFGAGISNIIYVYNAGSADADVSVSARDQSGTLYGPVKLSVQAVGRGVTQIGPQTAQALFDAGMPTNARARVQVTVNSSSIETFAAYNVRGDRLATTVN